MKDGSIILYHTDTDLPNHLFDCIKKIKKLSNIPIYLLTDKTCEIEDIEIIDIKKYTELNWLNDINCFPVDNFQHLWKSSCFRLFYIKIFLEEKNLNHILHFDNDVLLFEKPETIIENMCKINQDYLITAHNDYEVVMGMSYIKNFESLKNITSFIKGELIKGFGYLQSKYGNWPNEMQLISKCQLYDTLPILPSKISTERYSKHFDIFGSVFDPSSYGQYFAGTFNEKKPGWCGEHHEIGKHIIKNKINVFMENKNPYLICEGYKIKINNLHIHSKQTKAFL